MNSKRNKYVLFGIIGILLVGLTVFGISFALKSDNNFLRNQKVDGLSFENARIEYKDDKSTFSVIVYNENNGVHNAKSIDIKLKDKSGEVTTLTTDIDIPLESDEGRLLTATTDADITNMKSLEYIINK